MEQDRNDHTKALSLAKEAAVLAEKTGNLELTWEIHGLIGKSQLALKQPDQARQSFEQAVATVERLRGQAAGGELAQRYFLEHRLGPYHSLIALLVGQGKAERGIGMGGALEGARAAGCDSKWPLDVSRAMTAAELKQERALRAEIISLNTQVTSASQFDKPDQSRLDELKSLREKARLNYEAFQTSLYAAHPELRVQRGEAAVINSEEIAALLPDAGSALLEYVVTDDATYLFAVTKLLAKPPPPCRSSLCQSSVRNWKSEPKAFASNLPVAI